MTRPHVTVQANQNNDRRQTNVNMRAVLMMGDETFPVMVKEITKEQEWQGKDEQAFGGGNR